MIRRIAVFAVLMLVGAVAVGGIAMGHPKTSPKAHQASRGPRGRRGPRGPQGQPGPAGTSGIAGIHYVDGPPVPICGFSTGTCSVASAAAGCPAGSIAVGGAANVDTIETSISTYISPSGYAAVADNSSDFAGNLQVTVTCASGPGVQALAKDAAAPMRTMASVVARLRRER